MRAAGTWWAGRVALPFARSDYRVESFDRLGVECPPSIARSAHKRQVEFLCGRLAAKHALRQLGDSVADAPIGMGDSRQPLWPSRVLGTISHVHDLAVAAVTRTTDCAALGVDVEEVVGSEARVALTRRALDAQELQLLERAGNATSISERVTIAFSAKESLFKAAFDEVGRWFGFTAARVTDFDAESGHIVLTMTESLADGYRAGRACDVRFGRLRPGTVMTLYAPVG